MKRLRDELKITSAWSSREAANGGTVTLTYVVRNLSTQSGVLRLQHCVPRGTQIVGFSAPGTVSQYAASGRGYTWITDLLASSEVVFQVRVRLNIYVDDNGSAISYLEAPRKVLDTVMLGSLRFDTIGTEPADPLHWSFNDPGDQHCTALLLVQ